MLGMLEIIAANISIALCLRPKLFEAHKIKQIQIGRQNLVNDDTTISMRRKDDNRFGFREIMST